MKANKIISTAGMYVLAGAATAAGVALWNKVLEEKVFMLRHKIKAKKDTKVINFKKTKRRLSR